MIIISIVAVLIQGKRCVKTFRAKFLNTGHANFRMAL